MSEEFFEDVRERYIPSLGRDDVYLDHAGATLPRSDMLQQIFQELYQSSRFLGNPHTKSTSGRYTEDIISSTRDAILSFFDAGDDYEVVFTSNATSGMKLVGEIFPWTSNSILAYPTNVHTSFLGIRAYVDNVVCFPSDFLSVYQASDNDANLSSVPCSKNYQDITTYSLLLVPGECNYTGMKSNLSIPGSICSNALHCLNNSQIVKGSILSTENNKWLWFLDAAKLASTSKISLASISQQNRPHFVSVSFYKIFGYPSGIGALLVHKDIKHILNKKYYGGGTVAAISAKENYLVGKCISESDLGSLLEDGTPNYHGIAALRYGFECIKSMGGMEAIQNHTFTLANYVANSMLSLRHASGKQVVKVHGLYNNPGECNTNSQGSIVSFNLMWNDESPVGFGYVSELAERNNITLRTGCFCNPGGCQEILNISCDDVKRNYELGRVCGEDGGDVLNGKATGSIRASLGFSSTRKDCDLLIQFIKTNFQDKSNPSTLSLSIDHIIINTKKLELEDKLSKLPLSTYEIKIKSLYIYPIKSCGGFEIPHSWPVSQSGLYLDRVFAIVDKLSNKILTQKNYSILSQVNVRPDLKIGVIYVSHHSMEDILQINIPMNTRKEPINDKLVVRLCGRKQTASSIQNIGDTNYADEWFSKLLGISNKCSLVTSDYEDSNSHSKSKFVNDGQLLVISEESVRSLQCMFSNMKEDNNMIENNVSIANFRPNILTCGGNGIPHQEDDWKKFKLGYFLDEECSGEPVGKLDWTVSGPCSRCSAININGANGAIDNRILSVVGKYRKSNEGSRINFGQFLEWNSTNAVVSDHLGFYIRVGSIIEVE